MRGDAPPARTGIGLRAVHQPTILDSWPTTAWFEAHAENYFADGGVQVESLFRIRARYPLALHGVGLSLGSTDPLSGRHLQLLKRAVNRFEPALVSEHLSWSSVGNRFANDLLPLPFTEEAVRHVSARIAAVQSALGREILIENVASYLQFSSSEMTEWEFLSAVATEAGCGLLIDVNNVYVAAHNHGFECSDYLDGITPARVRELHLAGHERRVCDGEELLIDTHGKPVCAAVWSLFESALQRFGDIPALIEWDTDIPSFDVLAATAREADHRRARVHADAA